MIYDTLFATDANGQIKPQMIDKYDLSPDKLTYTMACATASSGTTASRSPPRIASRRSSAGVRRTRPGQKMMSFVKDMQVVDAKTFRIVLECADRAWC